MRARGRRRLCRLPSPVRTVELRGSLGNQLFCIAFAHSVLELTGEPVRLVRRKRHAGDDQGIGLDDLAERLGLEPPSRSGVDAETESVIPASTREGAAPATIDALRRFVLGGRHFAGYWQNQAYFADPAKLRDEIGRHLRRQGAAPAHEAVIHFRAYRDEPLPWRRRIPRRDYFARAIALIAKADGEPQEVLVVSDQPVIARSRMAGLHPGIRIAEAASAIDDMALLLSARGLILCNSSFSWWAGYCGAASRVIYPRRRGYFHYPEPAAAFTVI